MPANTGARRTSSVLPPRRLRGVEKMSPNSNEEWPVLPPKDPKQKPRGTTVNLPGYMWDQLDEIAKASGEYSRNEVIQFFLENRIAAWREEMSARKSTKK